MSPLHSAMPVGTSAVPLMRARVDRRDLFKFAAAAFAGAAVPTAAGVALAGPANAALVQWPGYKPGQIYLGISGDLTSTLAKTGPVGLRRSFFRWGDASRENQLIAQDHAANRLPWVSFKPPYGSYGAWSAVAAGNYDADIRARARRYAALSRPVVVTFNHEPQTDGGVGTPADFARAWTRIHDVMNNETGLRNVVSVPILGEWVFNPINKGPDPEAYITGPVLDRCHFLAVDLYQNASGQGYSERLGRVLNWLDVRGHSQKMVGVGETGCTDSYGNPSGAEWWTASWNWAVSHRDRVAAISYFNSLNNNNSGNNWLLTQSTAKLNAFRASLASTVSCTL